MIFVIYFFSFAIESICIGMVIGSFIEARIMAIRKIILLIMGFSSLSAFLLLSFPEVSIVKILVINLPTVLLIAYIYLSKKNIVSFFFLYIFAFTYVGTLSEMIVSVLIRYVLKIPVEDLQGSFGSIAAVVFSLRLISLLLAFLFRSMKLNPYYLKPIQWIELLIIFIINTLFATRIAHTMLTTRDFLTSFTSITSFFFVAYLSLRVCIHIVKYANHSIEWQIKEREYNQMHSYYERMNTITDELKAQRHDFNNHLHCIQGYLLMEEFDAARDYTMNLVDMASNFNELLQIKNPTVASMVNSKQRLAALKGIDIDFKINMRSSSNINPVDLCIVLGNLLDNAIEATEKVETEADQDSTLLLPPIIHLKLNHTGHQLIGHIANPFIIEAEDAEAFQHQAQSQGQRRSSKSDSSNHGYGIENVCYVVARYHGEYKQWTEGSTYHCHFILEDVESTAVSPSHFKALLKRVKAS